MVPAAPTAVPAISLLTSMLYSVLLVGEVSQLQPVPLVVHATRPDAPTVTQSLASQHDTPYRSSWLPSDWKAQVPPPLVVATISPVPVTAFPTAKHTVVLVHATAFSAWLAPLGG